MKRNHGASHQPKENIDLLWDCGKGEQASKKEAIVFSIDSRQSRTMYQLLT